MKIKKLRTLGAVLLSLTIISQSTLTCYGEIITENIPKPVVTEVPTLYNSQGLGPFRVTTTAPNEDEGQHNPGASLIYTQTAYTTAPPKTTTAKTTTAKTSKSSTTSQGTSSSVSTETSTVIESSVTPTLEKLEDSIKSLSESEKEAYAILTNKYMTSEEMQAFEWSLILSQFAVPYKESIQDVLTYTSFQEMDSKGTTITDNPYMEAIEAITNKSLDAAMSKTTSTTTDFKKLFEVLSEENEVSYSTVVKEGGEPAYLTDLFEQKCLFVKDKVALTGSATNSSTLWEGIGTLGDELLYNSKSKKEVVASIKNSNKIVSIEVPVWVMTDSTIMYNSIFVANAIRMGGYKDYETFIESVGNAPLFVDRWGDVCAYLSINGTYKYCIVYPNYCNPIYTSTELKDDDYAGFFCDSIGSDEAWIVNDAGTEVTFNKELFKITVEEAKKLIPQSLGAVEDESRKKSVYLGAGFDGLDNEGASLSFDDNYLLNTNGLNSSEAVYTRSVNSFKGSLPIVASLDTSSNFLYNKAIMSAYTRDGISESSGTSSDFYNCFSKELPAYDPLSELTNYKVESQASSYGFKDNIVFDKFFLDCKISTLREQDESLIKISDNVSINDSDIWLSLGTPTLSGNVYTSKGTNNKIQQVDDLITVNDGNINTIIHKTLYPFMVLHSYRKGLYSENPTLIGVSGGAGLLDVSVTRPVSATWSLENTVSSPSDVTYERLGKKLSEGCYTDYRKWRTESIQTLNLENLWNAIESASDSYKTFITFNYEPEYLPDTTALSGINGQLKSEKEAEWYEVFHYDSHYDSVYTETLREDIGKKYISFPILDNVLDTCEDWEVFTGGSSTSLRDRSEMSVKAESSKGLLTGVTIKDSNSNQSIRYYLNDTRISDLLENYPVEDFILLAFIWRNYYLDQSPLRTKVSQIISMGGTNDGESPESNESQSSQNDETPDVTNGLSIGSATKEFTLGEEYLYPTNTALTYLMIADESFNNEFFFTTECDSEKESLLWSNLSTSNTTSLKLSKRGYYVRYNMGSVLLAVNKNMNEDSVLYYESLIDKSIKGSAFDTDKILEFFTEFKENPGLAMTNLILSLAQLIHNNVAVGNICNLFDVSWLLNLGGTSILQTYMVVSSIVYLVLLFIYMIKFMLDKTKDTISVIIDPIKMFALGMLPVVVVFSLSKSIELISKATTQNLASSLVSIEIEDKVHDSESLDLEVETAYNVFRQQFDDIGDNYKNLTLSIVKGYNPYTDEVTYESIDVSKLYENVSYEHLLTDVSAYAKLCETEAETNGESFTVPESDEEIKKDIYGTSKGEVTPLYYSYEQFIPVNYQHYSESIFYYFYDWIKYQYLAYWANNTEASNSAFTSAAKMYSLPDVEKDEPWSTYIKRMWDAEKSMLVKSYYGCYSMYSDENYVSGAVSDKYVQDLFGFSNLFHMTRQYRVGAVGVPDYTYMSISTSESPTLGDWSDVVIEQCENVIGTYTSYCQSIKRVKDSGGSDIDTLTNSFYPIAFLSKSPAWNLYKKCNAISINSNSDTLSEYCFTPDYLNERLVNEESDYGVLWRYLCNFDNPSGLEICGRSVQASYDSSQRIPWRVYGSKAKLNDNGLPCSSRSDVTDLERRLNNLNGIILDRVLTQCEFMNGEIRDSSLIFNAALTATFEFNKEFYGDSLFSSIEPTSLTVSSIDLDKLMRVVFAKSLGDIEDNRSTMYMIYDSQGNNIFTVLALLIAEIEILCTIVLRFGIMVLIFLGSILLFLSFVFAKQVNVREIIIGLVTNSMLLLVSHLAMLGTIMIGLELISKSSEGISETLGGNVASAIVSVIFVLVYFAIMKGMFGLLTNLGKDLHTFGGSVVSDKLYAKSVSMHMDSINNATNYNPEVTIVNTLGDETTVVQDNQDNSVLINKILKITEEEPKKEKAPEGQKPKNKETVEPNNSAITIIVEANKQGEDSKREKTEDIDTPDDFL